MHYISKLALAVCALATATSTLAYPTTGQLVLYPGPGEGHCEPEVLWVCCRVDNPDFCICQYTQRPGRCPAGWFELK